MNRLFYPANILIPKDCDMNKWSVVACDQFSSQPEYWESLETLCKGVPSSLHLMLPEAYLSVKNQFEEAKRINSEMNHYLETDVFRELHNCYVFLERTLSSGVIRRGLLGVLDLEEYDYSKGSVSPIRATEGTVEDRLPPRVRVRSEASLEMPHIMVFIDDPEDTVMGLLAKEKQRLTEIYNFDLCAGGGHLQGWQVTEDISLLLETKLEALSDSDILKQKYGTYAPVVYAMGDGNHSLATAKKCWENIKKSLPITEQKTHPARFSLVELVNIHDMAITFEPIHKVVFGTNPEFFIDAAQSAFKSMTGSGNTSHVIRLVTSKENKEFVVTGMTIGQLIGKAEEFCQSYIKEYGGKIDYIHNDDTAVEMGKRTGNAAILLPKMEKDELFPSVIKSGPFPKKSFSIGHAEDKRYYLECRRIR